MCFLIWSFVFKAEEVYDWSYFRTVSDYLFYNVFKTVSVELEAAISKTIVSYSWRSYLQLFRVKIITLLTIFILTVGLIFIYLNMSASRSNNLSISLLLLFSPNFLFLLTLNKLLRLQIADSSFCAPPLLLWFFNPQFYYETRSNDLFDLFLQHFFNLCYLILRHVIQNIVNFVFFKVFWINFVDVIAFLYGLLLYSDSFKIINLPTI